MKKNDIILIAIIVLIALAALVFYQINKKTGNYLIATVDGVEYGTYFLDHDQVITIEDEDGHKNVFEIKDGHVHMSEASCPDKLCVSQSAIQFNHETIVCLPNKVVLTVISEVESQVDMISQ